MQTLSIPWGGTNEKGLRRTKKVEKAQKNYFDQLSGAHSTQNNLFFCTASYIIDLNTIPEDLSPIIIDANGQMAKPNSQNQIIVLEGEKFTLMCPGRKFSKIDLVEVVVR